VDRGRKSERLRKKISGRLAPQTMEVSPRFTDCTFSVIDMETTGLANDDRVLEIAIVRFSGDGKHFDQWTTLVNPARDLGATDIHEVRDFLEVKHAPRFEDIAGDIADRIQGTVLVAHNAAFDVRFLLKEFKRIGVDLPELPTLCTLRLGCKLGAHSRGLLACCTQFGIPIGNAHRALDDAQSAARLLALYLMCCQTNGLGTLSDLGCTAPLLKAWPPVPRPTRDPIVHRPTGVRHHNAYLSRLVARLPDEGEPEVVEYLGLLDRALEDFQVSLAEAEALQLHAKENGLTNKVGELNASYLEALIVSAWEDAVLTAEELEQLQLVATLLGFAPEHLSALIAKHNPHL